MKALVVACNTSTAVGLGSFRRRYALPVLGVIRPGAATAALATRNGRVGVIATPATIRSHAYRAAIADENPSVAVTEHATPALVPLVEAGELSGPTAEATVADALAPLAASGIDTLLLGCTHYPLLRPLIAAIEGDGVAIVDSANATASALVELLHATGLEASRDDDDGEGARAAPAVHMQLTTGDPARFADVADRLFGPDFIVAEPVDLGAVVR